MIVVCPSCQARLRVNEKALSPQNPLISCVRCHAPIKIDLPVAARTASEESTFVFEPAEVGWIVVHDEFTESQTLPLKPGVQVIGRFSVSKPCEVMIRSEDRFMSRHHLVVEAVKSKEGSYKYWVSDHPDCTNPTFIDTYPLKRGTTLELVDGVVMQLGKTKVTLKTAAAAGTARKATETVLNTDFAKTVLF
ncbi:FHA domain-containing protein [Dyadobacter pollutisoli]|uniref:FHA domain-containing protein n=1 Tax=Dyadobacter pollutisoli TaxID=2910158 RepID=A0A9E8N5H8_9BACT|nr:FHA domain-containing protein [Dyadobacter pollutisoli]WAC10145.1 FHA domain-containing protein [Dyadobacter pollutisoli]